MLVISQFVAVIWLVQKKPRHKSELCNSQLVLSQEQNLLVLKMLIGQLFDVMELVV